MATLTYDFYYKSAQDFLNLLSYMNTKGNKIRTKSHSEKLYGNTI